MLKAHAESAWKRHVEEETDTCPKNTSVLLADALMTVVREHPAHRQAPAYGGDRPWVTVLLSLEALRRGLADAALGSGGMLTAAEARRLACDADLIATDSLRRDSCSGSQCGNGRRSPVASSQVDQVCLTNED